MVEWQGSETVRLSTRIRHRAIAGEGVMVHLGRGQVLVVNQVGLHVVNALAKGPTTVTELAAAVAAAYGIDAQRAHRDVIAFLDQLLAEEAIEVEPAGVDGLPRE
ncbi:MAG TPA: PqqD family protein [Thermoanaerobaculaceae bacterium]|nr:PqqD family protein [Thermoanaerobaculaceae bacterium]HRS15937.1 PqqD family protein [Thermoanaerobaculaceae bacterium]